MGVPVLGDMYHPQNQNFRKLRPNQSLKLTEIAVDDLTRAKQTVTCWTGHTTRGMDSVAAALRCRSLAPVR